MASSFCSLVGLGGSGPNVASPGMFGLRTMAGSVSTGAIVAGIDVMITIVTATTVSSITHTIFFISPPFESNEERAIQWCKIGYRRRDRGGRVERRSDALLESEASFRIDCLLNFHEPFVVVAVKLCLPIVQEWIDVIAVSAD